MKTGLINSFMDATLSKALELVSHFASGGFGWMWFIAISSVVPVMSFTGLDWK